MRKITFSCCNKANPDCHNIADAFIKRMKVKTVVGFDGGALFDYPDNKLKKGIEGENMKKKIIYVCVGVFLIYEIISVCSSSA